MNETARKNGTDSFSNPAYIFLKETAVKTNQDDNKRVVPFQIFERIFEFLFFSVGIVSTRVDLIKYEGGSEMVIKRENKYRSAKFRGGISCVESGARKTW